MDSSFWGLKAMHCKWRAFISGICFLCCSKGFYVHLPSGHGIRLICLLILLLEKGDCEEYIKINSGTGLHLG